MSIWELVCEEFDEKLPRRTAILVKEEDWGLPFAYPCDFGGIGWNIDYREKTTYDEAPIAIVRFGDHSYPDLTGKTAARNTFHFRKMEYLPGLVRREAAFSNIGLEAQERFAQSAGGGWAWHLDLTNLSLPHKPLRKKLYVTVSFADSQTRVREEDGVLSCETSAKTLYLATDAARWGVYDTTEDYQAAITEGKAANRRTRGKHLVLELELASEQYGETLSVRFGMSFQSAEKARRAAAARNLEAGLQRKWDAWFAKLPPLEGASERDLKAYYKCWWTVRTNYYRHPRWGKSVLEALPVYRGFWQWGLPAAEWHSSPNPEITPSFTRRVLDLFLQYQREDGYVTHAIYLDEEEPGSSWARGNIIQTPHIPWVALRYFAATDDLKSLRRWYPHLVRYYEYLNRSRDEEFLGLHLWAIITSFDTGLDTTSVFQKVTYGEDGVRERFCYPAIFAAERCRYEQAMAKMARLLGEDEEPWLRESEATKKAMDRVLWDSGRKWYGVLHEDGSLDTRVGVDGLFPLAYGLVTESRARQMRKNFASLLGPYGTCTVAPGEPGYYADTYWRGPVWPKSCSMAMGAARNYYPDLLDEVREGLVSFLLRYPNVWECMNAWTGQIARGDMGQMATPGVSSNVGAGEALGALRMAHGTDMLEF